MNKNNVGTVIEAIVHTLLQVGERVVEISRDGVICEIWERGGVRIQTSRADIAGKKLNESGDRLLAGCTKVVAESFGNGQRGYAELTVNEGKKATTYAVRILPVHPDKDKLFLVTEELKRSPVATDLNDQAEALETTELLLERLRLFYERILNNITADIVVLDADYRFLYVNPSAEPDEETRRWLIGKTDEEFLISKGKSLAISDRRKIMYEAARHERQVIEWVEKNVTLFGTIQHILRRIYPVFDKKGNLDILIGYSVKITDLISIQEDLKTNRDIFASAFHDSGIGMAMLSPDGTWLDVNRVLCEMTGYTREEFMKTKLRDITYPEERRENKALVEKMLRREIPSFTMERRYISRQGKLVFVLATLSLVWGKDDQPKFFIAQAVDITQKTELETKMIRKNAELEATRINLVNKVSQLEELSYIIAHNLRGPAANIKLLTDALLTKSSNDETEGNLGSAFTIEEGLGFINEASTTMMNSLASLMKIAEIKLNKNIPVNDCDVNSIIDDVVSQLQSAIFEKKASIKLSLEVCTIMYPKAYLESILYNLISNALKYSKPGGAPEIVISTSVAGDKIRLSVKDNGLGIDMERYGDRMFKMNQVFHAGHDSKGFGLYLTKTQVESLGGSISVESKLNEGSEFVVMI